jgi:two-component system chemotaxis response regulator CheB
MATDEADPVRVLVVNDSATVRALLRATLDAAAGFEVVGESADGRDAAALVLATRPSVVVMDVVMPRVDGYAATREIMARAPVPIVLVSSVVNPRDVAVAMESLRSGALAIAEALPSPHDPAFPARREALLHLLRSMARVRVTANAPAPAAAPVRAAPRGPSRVGAAAIGLVASTGGPGALVTVLRALAERPLPPVLLVQHLAAGYTTGFAAWLQGMIRRPVRVAQHLEPLEHDRVYVAPDDRHLGVDALRRALVSDEAPVGVFRPAGTWLLRSMARALGPAARAAVLTGMGDDGADGAVELRRAGGRVAVQDEASCVIYGMPAVTAARGGADVVLPLAQIAAWLTEGAA